MFTIEQIKDAYSKVQSGMDFPMYVSDLFEIGVLGYETFVRDGNTIYFGANDFTLESEARYLPIGVAEKSNVKEFQHYLKIHHRGQTNFPAFCYHLALTGVGKWKVDTKRRTCTFFDKAGNKMFVENIQKPY